MANHVLAIDQGTTSSRALVFDSSGKVIAKHQQELPNIYPQAGWCEHDPDVIWQTVVECINNVVQQVGQDKIVAVGITNQRETTVAWSRSTGKKLCNAIVWLDTRTKQIVEQLENVDGSSCFGSGTGKDRFREKTGLPLATYFSAVKMKWMLDNVPEVKQASEKDDLCFGTVDSWLLHKLTGGQVFVTDVSNASRYMLMNIQQRQWDASVCSDIGIPIHALPEIKSNAEEYGKCTIDALLGVPITGSLGDQHAALLGQGCLEKGQVKNTYGTGCFMLMNTQQMVPSQNGLLTTMGFQLGPDSNPVYALEGSVAVAGRCVQWLRDNMNLISDAAEIETLASSVKDSGGVTLVPAFSGLFAPYWKSHARAVLVGMSLYTTKEHIARAALEAVAFQVYDVLDAMESDSGHKIRMLRVDGGMTVNKILMQFQADICRMSNHSKWEKQRLLGAAFAAGLAAKVWSSPDDIHKLIAANDGHHNYSPEMDTDTVKSHVERWKDAVPRSYHLSKF